MVTWLLVLLVLLLAWFIRGHVKSVKLVRRAIAARQIILRDEAPAAKPRAWDGLVDAVNELVADARRLDHLRTTQYSQLRAMLDSIQEAVLIVDGDNYVRLANPAFSSIFPKSGAGIVGLRLETVLHSPAFIAFVAESRRNHDRPRQQFEIPHGGASVWIEVSAAPVAPLDKAESQTKAGDNGEPEQWTLLVLHDLTRQKHLEAVRKDFVANVSHELRTPLSVIKGYLETLLDEHSTMSTEDRARFLATAHRHSERLNRIVEDLLVLSRLESSSPGIRREPTDVASLLEGVAQDYGNRGFALLTSAGGTAHASTADPAPGSLQGEPTHRLRLDLDGALPPVPLDPLKMTQVFGNLLDNALKYTPPGTTVTLSARVADGELEFLVADTGAGIAASDLPRLFERFYRVDKGRSRDTGGTGLGLSIVKHIVQLHGGRVTVTSRQAPTADPRGAGTTFTIRLPLAAPEA